MALNSYSRIALGLLLTSAFSTPAMAVDEITHVTLSPSHTVVLGQTVTVTVHGSGSCAWVVVETNGASPVEGGALGDYQVGPGSFPMSVSFVTHEVGSFKIAALGVDADGDLCVQGGTFGKNTTLLVLHPADPRVFEGMRYPIPKPQPWVGPGPLRYDPAQPQLGPEGLSDSPVSTPVWRTQHEPLVGQQPQAAPQPTLAPARKSAATANPTVAPSSLAPLPNAAATHSR